MANHRDHFSFVIFRILKQVVCVQLTTRSFDLAFCFFAHSFMFFLWFMIYGLITAHMNFLNPSHIICLPALFSTPQKQMCFLGTGMLFLFIFNGLCLNRCLINICWINVFSLFENSTTTPDFPFRTKISLATKISFFFSELNVLFLYPSLIFSHVLSSLLGYF